MIKSVLKLLLLLCVVALVIFTYQTQGYVDIRWQGVSISMKIGTFVLLLMFGTCVLFYLFSFMNYLSQLAKHLKKYWQTRHETEGQRNVEEAISAMVGGMPNVALKRARKGAELLKTPMARWVYAFVSKENGAPIDEVLLDGLIKSKSFGLAGYRLRIEHMLHQRDHAGIVAEIEAALERYPNATWMLEVLFKILIRSGDVKRAIEVAKKLKQLAHVDADSKMAFCYFLQSRSEVSADQKLKLLQHAFELEKTSAVIGGELSKIYLMDGRIKKAQTVIETVWRYTRQDDLGDLYLQTLQDQNSEEKLNGALKLLEISNASIEGYIVVIKACVDSEFYQKARYYLEKAIHANGGMSYRLLKLRVDLTQKDLAEKINYPVWIGQVASLKKFEGWTCANCRSVFSQWEAECLRCGEVNSCFWKGEHELENNFFAIKGN
jgi:uncharacterized membrane-anchored protein